MAVNSFFDSSLKICHEKWNTVHENETHMKKTIEVIHTLWLRNTLSGRVTYVHRTQEYPRGTGDSSGVWSKQSRPLYSWSCRTVIGWEWSGLGNLSADEFELWSRNVDNRSGATWRGICSVPITAVRRTIVNVLIQWKILPVPGWPQGRVDARTG